VDYEELFANIRRRPEMFGLDGSFQGFCAFLLGIDYGNDRKFLIGFREMLVVQLGAGANLTWPALVLRVAFPDRDSVDRDRLAEPEANRRAVDALFTWLAEFRTRTAEQDGLLRIFAAYQAALDAERW
jgi:hypothetical protein